MSEPPPSAAVDRARFVEDLLGYLSLTEKVGQLVLAAVDDFDGGRQRGRLPARLLDCIRAGAISAVTGIDGASEAELVRRVATEESRSGIPVLIASRLESHGQTVLPAPVSMAASWDPTTVERASAVVAAEARGRGVRWALAPHVELAPWLAESGIAHSSGEEPYLASQLALARMRGLQGPADDPSGLIACLGLPDGGWSAGVRGLAGREGGLANAFALILSAMEMGVGSLAVDPAFPNRHEPGEGGRAQNWLYRPRSYTGIVLAEWTALSRMAGEEPRADRPYRISPEKLAAAVADGRVPVVRLDDAVRRVIAIKYDLGLFRDALDPRSVRTGAGYLPPVEQRHAAALDLARKSIILLRNEGGLLPLPPHQQNLLVIGSAASDARLPMHGHAGRAVTLIEGLEAARINVRATPGLALRHDGSDAGDRMIEADRMAIGMAGEAARRADRVLLVLGETPGGTRAGDLGEAQRRLLETVLGVNPNVVLVTLGERPVDPVVEGRHLPAVLHAGLLGTTSGHAIADILTGAAPPSGALPFAMQSRGADRLMPLGHGLGFTDFVLGEAVISREDDGFRIASTIANIGGREGEALIQLYLWQATAGGAVQRPVLRGFKRVALAPDEARRVAFTLGPQVLGRFSAEGRFEVNAGSYRVGLGLDAATLKEAEFVLSDADAHLVQSPGGRQALSRRHR